MSLWLTVWFWIKSNHRWGPFGGCSPSHSADSGMVSLFQIPRLTAQITPSPHCFCTLPYSPPVRPSSFAALDTVPVAGKDREHPHRSEDDCSESPAQAGTMRTKEVNSKNTPLLVQFAFKQETSAYMGCWLDRVTFFFCFCPSLLSRLLFVCKFLWDLLKKGLYKYINISFNQVNSKIVTVQPTQK